MRKNALRLIILFAVVVFAALTLSACQIDTFGRPDDYVEVDRLTIDSANVFLSPAGETASYQLDVRILPENASNRKLNYYIKSEHLVYLRVSDTGLLTATGQEAPEDLIIPIRISSTTNPNAFLTVNARIETVSVKEISFESPQIELLYNDERGVQLTPVFTPYHAQDGRMVAYRSLNENVATVSTSGMVNAVNAGTTTILCEGTTTSGKVVTGRVEVKVVYAPGRYRLEVSDSNPQYNQVLGDFRAINFSLMSLDAHSDPNIRIQWYVNDRWVVELGTDSRQYEHTPDVEALTSYRIKVVIDSNYDTQHVLYSEPINIFGRFNGFSLDYENVKSPYPINYRYGDTGTFVLTEGQSAVSKYEWYLKRKNSIEEEELVATTSVTDRDLVRRMNIEGDFTLTAKGIDVNGAVVTTKEFDFSVTRLIAGDTLVINPVLLENGTPPETYNYFLSKCDENGVVEGAATAIGHSSDGETFCYTLNAPGNYILTANATLDGIVATVPDPDSDRKEKEFYYTSDVIRVYSPALIENHDEDLVEEDSDYYVYNECEISDIVITAVEQGEDRNVVVTWNAPLGKEDYTAEIKKDGYTYLFNNGAEFGNRTLTIPNEIADISDKFSIRIKVDGGLYSDPYYYGMDPKVGYEEYYYDTLPTYAYPYIASMDGNVTRYFRNMEQLGDMLSYLAAYMPANDYIVSSTESHDGVLFRVMKLAIMLDFDLKIADRYFLSDVPSDVPASLQQVYKAVLGAQNVFCPTDLYKFSFSARSDGGYDMTMMVTDGEQRLGETVEKSIYRSANYSLTPYGAGKNVHRIDDRQAKNVGSSEQLYSAVADGYKPYFTNDATRLLYDKALNVINTIIGKEMSDKEKVLAIFDYLTMNVKYDQASADASAEGGDYYSRASYFLEGVFNYNTAVCDGIAKAFVLLCGIEGIRAERVVGSIDGAPHAWNMVNLDGEYYVVDCTNGVALTEDGRNMPNYNFFLRSNREYNQQFKSVLLYGEYDACSTDNDHYDNGIGTEEQLLSIIDLPEVSAPTVISIAVATGYLFPEEIENTIESLTLTNNTVKEVVVFSDGRAIVIVE